jgi:hypothetical protein
MRKITMPRLETLRRRLGAIEYQEALEPSAMLQVFQIDDPCGVDNSHAVKTAFAAAYLPAYFLFDREGRLRTRAGGDAGLSLLEQPLLRLFERANAPRHSPPALGYLTNDLQ